MPLNLGPSSACFGLHSLLLVNIHLYQNTRNAQIRHVRVLPNLLHNDFISIISVYDTRSSHLFVEYTIVSIFF